VLASAACIAYNLCMQYTIRNIPDYLDAELRGVAHRQGKSLNEVAVEALERGAGLSGKRVRRRDMREIAGTWKHDPVFENALAAQQAIDEALWPSLQKASPIARKTAGKGTAA